MPFLFPLVVAMMLIELQCRTALESCGRVLILGAPGETRTPDLLVRSQPLYPPELRARKQRA